MNLGRYQLVRKLASGGMAEVYLARAAGPMGFEKKLVVKRILPQLAEDASFIEMFFAEARLVAKLDHPNIVQIFDFGEAEGAYFLAMEFIDGLNLRVLLKRVHAAGERLPIALCAKIISCACEGLAYAHELLDADTGKPLNLVHRDISPDNILVSSHGAVKLADFGIAKVANQVHRTQTGVLKGKVAYMPPEQLKSEPLDARTDLFALGVVLYELLSGHRPFKAENETSLILAILHEEPAPVTRYRDDVPPAMQRILARTLAREPSARYANCREFQVDLERFLRTVDEPVGPIDISRWVARFAPKGPAVDAVQTPNAKLLLETPLVPSLAAPVSTQVPLPGEITRQERITETRAGAVTPVQEVLLEEPSPVDDSPRTDPARTGGLPSLPTRWRRGVALGLSAVVLASTGYGLWWALRPEPAPVPASPPPVVEKAPPASPPTQVATSTAPPVEEPVPPPSAPPVEPKDMKPTEPPKPEPAPPPVTTNPSKPNPTSPPVVGPPAFFRVESTVAGSVLVAGRPFGSTPAEVKGITPGRVTVEVFDKQKGFSQKKVVKLKSGGNDPVRFTINKARLNFYALPYATVTMDGRELGLTPLRSVEVYEGRHSIRYFNKELNKQVTREFTVQPGDNEFKLNFNTLP